ncbi:MAG TPA: MOSC domain-containing protein, partial [Thermoanaerobaculia bacterium]|nr:MOSC domain-containing protein [Thermoanaerobaculia bacterium]
RALIDVAFEDDALRVDASGMPSLRIPLRESGVPRRDVKLFRRRRYGVPVSDAADRWFATVLGVRCSLVQMRAQDAVTFANERPLHLITEASVAELNADVEGDAVPSGRFRPNFVVAGPSPYQEDRWTEVRIGSVAFRRVEPTSRCAVTTVDSRTGTRGVEPLRTLGRTRSAITLRGRKLHFGQYLTLDGMGGEVHLGDEVRA